MGMVPPRQPWLRSRCELGSMRACSYTQLMATLTGEVLRMNTFDSVYKATGATVMVVQDRKAVAHGTVGDDERFEIELPEDLRGEIEIRVDLHGAAPVEATADGEDFEINVYYNNQQQYG